MKTAEILMVVTCACAASVRTGALQLSPHGQTAAARAPDGATAMREGLPPDAQPVPGAPGAFWHPDVPSGLVLIHGDVQVRLDDYMTSLYGLAVFGNVDFWTSQVVPYDFVTSGSGSVSTLNRQRCVGAMSLIAERTGLTFRSATSSDRDRIRFQSSSGNNSYIGRQGGVQIINLFNFNYPIIIVHELYHALGFWHQQSASNRDTYVTINLDNVSTTACGGTCAPQFAIVAGASRYGDYDFDSLMHYGRDDFSSNGLDTITVKPPWAAEWQDAIGQRDHISTWDELVCRGIYPYPSDYWWETGGNGAGTLVDPIGGSLEDRMRSLPSGATLFIKDSGHFQADGTFTRPITLRAPRGATIE